MHEASDVCPTEMEYVLAPHDPLQSLASSCPGEFPNKPAAHSVQSSRESKLVVVPVGPELYLPAGQLMQAIAPPGEYVPRGQSVQAPPDPSLL